MVHLCLAALLLHGRSKPIAPRAGFHIVVDIDPRDRRGTLKVFALKGYVLKDGTIAAGGELLLGPAKCSNHVPHPEANPCQQNAEGPFPANQYAVGEFRRYAKGTKKFDAMYKAIVLFPPQGTCARKRCTWIHGGRNNWDHPTEGCVRTSDAVIDQVIALSSDYPSLLNQVTVNDASQGTSAKADFTLTPLFQNANIFASTDSFSPGESELLVIGLSILKGDKPASDLRELSPDQVVELKKLAASGNAGSEGVVAAFSLALKNIDVALNVSRVMSIYRTWNAGESGFDDSVEVEDLPDALNQIYLATKDDSALKALLDLHGDGAAAEVQHEGLRSALEQFPEAFSKLAKQDLSFKQDLEHFAKPSITPDRSVRISIQSVLGKG